MTAEGILTGDTGTGPRRRRPPRRAELDRTPIRQAVNVGPSLAEALRGAGIPDVESLAALGAPAAWRRLAAARPELATHRVLYALGGAVAGVRWPLLSEEAKAALGRAAGGAAGRRTTIGTPGSTSPLKTSGGDQG